MRSSANTTSHTNLVTDQRTATVSFRNAGPHLPTSGFDFHIHAYVFQETLFCIFDLFLNPLGARKNREEVMSLTKTHLPLPTDITSRFPIRVEPRRSFSRA